MVKVLGIDFRTASSRTVVMKLGERGVIDGSAGKRMMPPVVAFTKPGDHFVILVAFLLVASAGAMFGQEVLVFDTKNTPTVSENKLLTINQSGAAPVVLQSNATFTASPSKMAVDRVNRRYYVCDQTTSGGGIIRFNADGGGKTTVYANSVAGSQMLGVAVDSTSGVLYFTSSNAGSTEDKLFKAGLDGSSPTVLVFGPSLTGVPGSVAVDEVNQRIYVCDGTTGGGGVFRFDSSGGSRTVVYANSTANSQVVGVAVDSRRSLVYFATANGTTTSERKLFRCDLDGTVGSRTVLASGTAALTSFPGQVAVDITQNRIYVCDTQSGGGGIFRFDSAGGSRTEVFTNITASSQVLGVALLSPATTTVSSINRVDSTPSSAGTVNWTVTFATQAYNITAGNFSLSGTGTAGATIQTPTTANLGTTWNVPVTTGTSDGTLQLDLANSTGMTPSISTALPFIGQTYTMDKTGPTVFISAPSLSATIGGPVTYTVTYTDANFNASTLASGNITLNSAGTASGSVTVSGSGTTKTVTISSITGNGTLGISIAASTATDTAGNNAPAAGPSTTFVVDTTNDAPTITGAAANQAVNDNAAISPFNALVIGDADQPAQTLSISISLDLAKGTFSTLNGFTSAGGGAFTFSGIAVDATAAIQGLVYDPTENRVTPGLTETNTLVIIANDGHATPVTNDTTTVISTSINDAPLAGADSIQRRPGNPVKVAITQLLSNDSDPEHEPLSLSLPSNLSANGATVTQEGNWIIYSSPVSDAVDTFQYTVSDGSGGSNVGTVTVTVQADETQSENILSIVVEGSDRVVTFAGIAGFSYEIQYTNDLSSPTWNTLTTQMTGVDGKLIYRDVSPPPLARYYRTIVPTPG